MEIIRRDKTKVENPCRLARTTYGVGPLHRAPWELVYLLCNPSISLVKIEKRQTALEHAAETFQRNINLPQNHYPRIRHYQDHNDLPLRSQAWLGPVLSPKRVT